MSEKYTNTPRALLIKNNKSVMFVIKMFVLSLLIGASSLSFADNKRELEIDHVMFPTYLSDTFLDLVMDNWKERSLGKVFSLPSNPSFKAVYAQSHSFYIEYLSNTESEPYWSNAVYVVVPKKYWDYYKNPAFKNEYFLIPSFGAGYQLVSPDYPYLNKPINRSNSINYDGFTLLISKSLEKELLSIGGVKWALPASGKIRVHDKLLHPHDIAVLDQDEKLVAPIFQPNPILREYL